MGTHPLAYVTIHPMFHITLVKNNYLTRFPVEGVPTGTVQPRLLRISEVARILNRSDFSVRRLVWRKKLHRVPDIRVVLITPESVEKYLRKIRN